MESLTDVKVEPFEQNWKDWFIIDEPEEKISLSVFLDQTRHFYVDSRFNRFKLSGTMKDGSLSQYKVWYKFKRKNILQSTYGYIYFVKDGDNFKRTIKCILTRGE